MPSKRGKSRALRACRGPPPRDAGDDRGYVGPVERLSGLLGAFLDLRRGRALKLRRACGERFWRCQLLLKAVPEGAGGFGRVLSRSP